MSKKSSPIHKIKPREMVGRDTGKRYQFQYRKAAEACLRLLEDGELERVYCDYHDDYVLKVIEGKNAFYLFHQVKTKSKKDGVWNSNDIFGIPKTKIKKGGMPTKNKGKDSIAGKLFYHHINFGEKCKSVHIVTNAEFDNAIQNLISDSANTNSPKELAEKNSLAKVIVEFFESEFDGISKDDVFKFLKLVKLEPKSGSLDDDISAQGSIFIEKINKYTEISLTEPEAEGIAKSLIDLVRNKSITTIDAESMTEEDIDQNSSIHLNDILSILSISKSAYELLKAGGDDKAIKSVSILQRVLERCQLNEDAVAAACEAKIQWDNWIRKNRHLIAEIDYSTLELHASNLTSKLKNGNIRIDQVFDEISSLHKTYKGKFPTAQSLTEDILFGLVCANIVKEEMF